jgi:hypothetical protein
MMTANARRRRASASTVEPGAAEPDGVEYSTWAVARGRAPVSAIVT